jgi:hypothetical protein
VILKCHVGISSDNPRGIDEVLTFTGTVEHEPIPDRKSWEIVHRSQNDHDGRNESVRPRLLVAV